MRVYTHDGLVMCPRCAYYVPMRRTEFENHEFDHVMARELRAKKGLEINWLANYCGVKAETMRKYLRGEVSPSRAVVILMSQAYGCDVSKLLRKVENKSAA